MAMVVHWRTKDASILRLANLHIASDINWTLPTEKSADCLNLFMSNPQGLILSNRRPDMHESYIPIIGLKYGHQNSKPIF